MSMRAIPQRVTLHFQQISETHFAYIKLQHNASTSSVYDATIDASCQCHTVERENISTNSKGSENYTLVPLVTLQKRFFLKYSLFLPLSFKLSEFRTKEDNSVQRIANTVYRILRCNPCLMAEYIKVSYFTDHTMNSGEEIKPSFMKNYMS